MIVFDVQYAQTRKISRSCIRNHVEATVVVPKEEDLVDKVCDCLWRCTGTGSPSSPALGTSTHHSMISDIIYSCHGIIYMTDLLSH